MKKILAFIKYKNKYLALRNNPQDPKHGGDFWYVVTGNIEQNEDLEKTVRREIFEETGLEPTKINDLDLSYEFINRGEKYNEYCFLAEVNIDKVKLNNENIDYKWLPLNEFINVIKWWDNKASLIKILDNN